MRKYLMAVAALILLTTAGSAADTEKMYLGSMGGKHMVMGGSNAQGTELMMGENGAKPSNCPAGSFYQTDSSQQMVMACDNDAQ